MFRQILVLTAVFAGIWALGSDEPAGADVAHAATATAATATAVELPAELPKVPVHIGYHRGYDRVVFAWPSPVDYSVTRKGDWVELRFTSAADVDLADLNADFSDHVGAGKVTVDGKKTRVSLAIDSSLRLRHFRSGTAVVFDILVPSTPPVQLADAGAPAND
jgi:hypothetical protein